MATKKAAPKTSAKAAPKAAPAAPAKPVVDEAAQLKELDELMERVKKAQAIYSTYTQEQVDKIFRECALSACAHRIELAKLAVEETGMGVLEDKVIKNHFASEFIYNSYKDAKTCGELEYDATYGIRRIAEPIGIIAGIVPTTNPTSTAIFKALIALKTRNGIVFSPHPRAKQATYEAAMIIHRAAVRAGAPEGIVGCIKEPTMAMSAALMHHKHTNLILATGGPGMVQAAYSSGKPALGVGAGNTPALIDETAHYKMAVSSILMSKTFDNGMICASEQSVIVVDSLYETVKQEFIERGAYLLNAAERKKVAATIFVDGHLNAKIVGQPAWKIAEMAGFSVPKSAKVLIGETKDITMGPEEPFSHEKLSPVLALYRAKNFEEGAMMAKKLIEAGGLGHTSVFYTNPANTDRIKSYGTMLPTGRVLVNIPASQGAIGDLYNFKLAPSLTLGCGSWGGNAVSENIGVKHLMNVKTIAERRENMLWFKVPPKVYFKYGCLPFALREINDRKRAFVVTDKPLFDLGYTEKVTSVLEDMGIDVEIFYEVKPDPDTDTIEAGLARMNSFKPDLIIALGGGSPMDAAKMMWLRYENPEAKFEDMAMRFMDIEKRIYTFPKLGAKAIMVAIPTTSGTGSEVTPFAVVTDSRTHKKYPIADYALTPDIAIADPELVLSMPRGLTAASGIDALVHALEAMVSVLSTEWSNALSLEAIRLVFKYLKQSYDEGGTNRKAREKMHYASNIAGMAFANAFLGLCHSMAHKLGAKYNIPHGVANALLICDIIRYNAVENPSKQAIFPQYTYPMARSRYARVADVLGLGYGLSDAEKVDALVKAVDGLKKSVGIPESIQAWGIPEEDFLAYVDTLSEEAFDDQCTPANPRYPLIAEIREIYLKAYYGAKYKAAEGAPAID
ncbi:MAG: bifunctional acetaldehyde-CoA/alcohol dehydrogenase [Kiritimatiellae bacterium]|nr:bifunctional acetaldehyde-CoA/alcohol dehydrogenase [Kiritimatiellia bacterium]MBR5588268.1 bifunctional acetaldehyde-CoA/alcohol dehydrogenase [Kiritimatiellia bacterium]